MSIPQSSLWSIVLAGGEGVRSKEFIHERIGTDAPKHFCAFVGTRMMLERTSLVPAVDLGIPAWRHSSVDTRYRRNVLAPVAAEQ